MACVSEMPQRQDLTMLIYKAQQTESTVAAWPAEEIDNYVCEIAQEIKIFPNKKQLKKKLARENNVTFHDGKPVKMISEGSNSRGSIIFMQSMVDELQRYFSFFSHKWPPTAPVTASVLAKAGFYFFGVDDTVQCFSCNGRINNWSPGDTAMGEHKRIYPRCKFVRGMDKRNVPARGLLDESNKQSTEGRKSLKSGKSSASEDEAGCSDNLLSELLQPLKLEESEPPREAKSYFMKEINRLLSFKIWPISSHVDRFDLAAAGFYCVNESNGTVQCFACFGRLSEWKAGDRPKSEHLRLFPSCPFILGRPTGNVPLTPTEKDQAVRFFSSSSSRLSRPLQIASNLSQSERYGLQGQSSSSRGSSENLGRRAALPEPADLTVKYAKYPNYAYEQARLETYGRWPNNHSQIPANLARAGFFATGNGDEVKCFYCGGGLKDWSIGDEAWEEHARWFTRCEWLLQQRGPAFVDAVQRKFGPSGHSYFEPNMGIPGDENAILPPTSPPAPPPTGQEQASAAAAAAEPEPRPAEQRKKKNENKRQTGKKQPDKKKQGKKNKPVNERVEELFQSDVAQFMVDMGQDETLIKTVLRKRLESGQSPYQTSEELLLAIFEEEKRQQAGAVSSVPAVEPASPKKKSNERRVSPDQEPTKEKPRDSSRTSPKRKQPAKHEDLSQQNVLFGQFKLQVAELLTIRDCLMLCTRFRLSLAFTEGICLSHNPSLQVMHHLEIRGIIRPDDVTGLEDALKMVNLNRAANQVREYQHNILRLQKNSEELEEEEEEEEAEYNEFEDHDYQTAIQALSDYITPADMTRLCAFFALTHRQTEKVRSSDTPARDFLSYLNRRGTIAPDDMTFLVEGLKEVGLVNVAQRLTTMLQEIESKEVEAESAVTVTGDLESQEIEKLREKNLCKICLDNDVEVLFFPCKHLVTCADCATRIDTCPICRTEIDDKVYVYMP